MDLDEKQTPDVCMPAYYNGKVYMLNGDKQVLTCLDPKTGAKIWQGNLGHRDTVRSSPTVADGKVYTISEKGILVICDANGTEFKAPLDLRIPECGPDSLVNRGLGWATLRPHSDRAILLGQVACERPPRRK